MRIDGLQPEKGHETRSVVRECTAKRLWFAQALLSGSADEIRPLVHKAKEWADQVDKPAALWASDKQDACVPAIRAEFPNVPHRYCPNHFPRDVARPVLEEDRHAEVTMRKTVRGLRAIERAVLAEPRTATEPQTTTDRPTAVGSPIPPVDAVAVRTVSSVGAVPAGVVLDCCAAVRGILNDNQGGPLHPPGLRMAEHLHEVRDALGRVLGAKKGGPETTT
ncbi:MAG: transposase [Gemmataceae bacterium]|nr:transposase [Gemmataceae bacterium]